METQIDFRSTKLKIHIDRIDKFRIILDQAEEHHNETKHKRIYFQREYTSTNFGSNIHDESMVCLDCVDNEKHEWDCLVE